MLLVSLPILIIYAFICLLSPILIIGCRKEGCEEEIFIVRDWVHSDYLFKSEQVKDLFPTKMNFVKVGWGDRRIFLELQSWSQLSIQDFLSAFFGMNDSVLRVEYMDEAPKGIKRLKVYRWQIDVIKKHINNSFSGAPIKKDPTYYQKGEYFNSSLNYNCITNCNNWVNRGLFISRVTNRIWSPLSFFT